MIENIKGKISDLSNRVFEKIVKKEVDKFIFDDFKVNNYKYFENIIDIKSWGQEYSQYYQKLINLSRRMQATNAQLDELNDLEFYSGYGSIRINDYLRGKTNDHSLNETIKIIDNHLSKFILKDNIVVTRRVKKNFMNKKYRINDIFIESGFLSTSLNLFHRLDDNSDLKPLKNEILLIIKIPKGIIGSYIEEAVPEQKQKREYEFLIARNQKIIVEYNKRILSNRLMKIRICDNDK